VGFFLPVVSLLQLAERGEQVAVLEVEDE